MEGMITGATCEGSSLWLRFPRIPSVEAALTLPATAALISLTSSTAATLEACFSQFGIHSLVLSEEIEQRMGKEKFDACVLPLNEKAEPILQAVRNSPSNRRIVVY